MISERKRWRAEFLFSLFARSQQHVLLLSLLLGNAGGRWLIALFSSSSSSYRNASHFPLPSPVRSYLGDCRCLCAYVHEEENGRGDRWSQEKEVVAASFSLSLSPFPFSRRRSLVNTFTHTFRLLAVDGVEGRYSGFTCALTWAQPLLRERGKAVSCFYLREIPFAHTSSSFFYFQETSASPPPSLFPTCKRHFSTSRRTYIVGTRRKKKPITLPLPTESLFSRGASCCFSEYYSRFSFLFRYVSLLCMLESFFLETLIVFGGSPLEKDGKGER